MKYIEYIVVLVIFLFLFFGIFLFNYKKGNRLSKNLLGIFFISLGLVVADVFLQINNTYAEFPRFAYIFTSLPFTLGPLIWLLTKSVTKRNFKLTTKDYLHFLPFIITILIFVFTYHIHSIAYKQEFLRQVETRENLPQILSSIFIFSVMMGYIFYSFKQLKTYQKEMKNLHSDVNKINLEWLRHILIGFVLIISISAITQILLHIFRKDGYWLNYFLIALLLGVFYFIISSITKGLKSGDIFSNLVYEPLESVPSSDLNKDKKIDKEKLATLKKLMIEELPFLNPSLSLQTLADQLNCSSRELSTIINQGTGKSFFDFINSYRIQFAKDKIHQTAKEGMTILEIMYASGFNSKSSFNTAFKKHTGFTPTQWKNQLTNK